MIADVRVFCCSAIEGKGLIITHTPSAEARMTFRDVLSAESSLVVKVDYWIRIGVTCSLKPLYKT